MKNITLLSFLLFLIFSSCENSSISNSEYLGNPIIAGMHRSHVITCSNGELIQWEVEAKTAKPINPYIISVSNPIHVMTGTVVAGNGEVYKWDVKDPSKLENLNFKKKVKKYYDYGKEQAILYADGTVFSTRFNTGIEDNPKKRGNIKLEDITDMALGRDILVACNSIGDVFVFRNWGAKPYSQKFNSDVVGKVVSVKNYDNARSTNVHGTVYCVNSNGDYILDSQLIPSYAKTLKSDKHTNFIGSGCQFHKNGVEVVMPDKDILMTLPFDTPNDVYYSYSSLFDIHRTYKRYSIGMDGSFEYSLITEVRDKKAGGFSPVYKPVFGERNKVEGFKFDITPFQ